MWFLEKIKGKNYYVKRLDIIDVFKGNDIIHRGVITRKVVSGEEGFTLLDLISLNSNNKIKKYHSFEDLQKAYPGVDLSNIETKTLAGII